MTSRIVIFVLFSLCFSLLSSGQDSGRFDFSMRRVSPEGGFTYGAINSIGEDAYGFIWFGTTHGLYRYNTVDIQKFTFNPDDSTTIPNNSVRSIFCDAAGTLWIGTSSGLCIYDNIHDQFIRKRFISEKGGALGNNIFEIFQCDSKYLYILSSLMLGRLNLETNLFENVTIEKTVQENFTCAAWDSSGNIWVGGINGTIWIYESESQRSRQFYSSRSEMIRNLFADDKGLWVAYNYSGLDYLGLQGNLIAHYGGNPEDVNRIHHNRVRDIYKDELGRIWVSTYKGISVIDQGKITNVLAHEISGLPYNSVFKIFRDSKDGIWIGTWSGGLAYRSNFDNHFIPFRKNQSAVETDDEFVSSFAETNDGTILIGTEFGNLNKLVRITNSMTDIPIRTENGKKIENIKSLLFDDKSGTLWVGTFLDGLWYQKKGETLLRPLNIFNNQRVSVYALEKSDSGLWIGTFGSGLYHYNIVTGQTRNYTVVADDSSSISNNAIRAIVEGVDHNIWIGTSNGLNLLNPRTGKFKRFNYRPGTINNISGNEILSLHRDQLGKIWIGTSGSGLNRYDQNTNTFESFKTGDGLIGNDVYGILEAKNGVIWVSTENGISSFDPTTSNFRSFYRENDLQGNQFNPGAAFITTSGELLFGDTKGFILFDPDEMKSNPFPPRVIFTTLSVNNIPVDIHSDHSPLRNTLQTATELKLSYNQNSLTINFVANNFLLPEKNRFKYRLINYDDEWIDAGKQSYATYTKIPHGNYLFEVVACNNDNLWSNTPAQLKISISPPPWFSFYAYVLYASVIAAAIFLIRRSLKERQRFKKELLMERLMHESEGRIHEMKMHFFTNISHEFRTPLTLIVSPINQLLAKLTLDPQLKERLLIIQRNANRLLQLINQLIDIHKIESGKAVFNPQQSDLVSLIKDVISYFEVEARDKNIQISFIPESDQLNVFIDREKADKIFFNILANAIKFSGENGVIAIAVYTTHSDEIVNENYTIGEKISGNIVSIEFSDNGPGIPPDETRLIFERFGQGKNHQSSGTGIGLHMALEYTIMHKGNISVRSRPGYGSTFTINLPLTDDLNPKTESLISGEVLFKNSEMVVEAKENDPLSEKEKSVTVLIIEDNFELRNYLKCLLAREYRIITASNGIQGLETALTVIPDLIITDIMMPRMDGFEVCRKIKNDIRTSHIPVILLTALYEAEKQVGGLRTGADAYITKPFDENIITAQVENLIKSRAKLREIYSVSATEWANEMEPLHSDRVLIEKASSTVEKHLNDKTFVIDTLASALGMSTSTMYRKLKYLTNQSPTEFVRYIRLKKAVKLMDDGNTNVDEVGYAVGFNSHSYFTSSFKKQYGITPTEYLSDRKSKRSEP